MATFSSKKDEILRLFCDCTKQQQNDVLLELLLKCEPLQLRILYYELKPLLAVNFVAYLPKELVDRIFFLLDAKDLCNIAMCNSLWREKANNNAIWKKLCKDKNWIKYGEDSSIYSNNETTMTTNPASSILNSIKSNLKTCRWKEIYIRAYLLNQNWNKGRYTAIHMLRGHNQRVVSLSCDGTLIASGSEDNTARIWDLHTGTCKHVLDNHTDSVRCLALKNSTLVTGCFDGIARVFDANTGRCMRSLTGHQSAIDGLCFDGTTIVTASADKTIRIWKLSTGHCLHIMRGHTDEIQAIKMKGKYIISSAWDDTIRLWDIHSGKCEKIWKNDAVAYCLKIDETKCYAGNDDGSIKIWTPKDQSPIMTLKGHTQEVYCLRNNENIIASGSADSTIRIWDHFGKCLHTLKGHIGVVRCLHLDGTRLVSGGDRKKIIIWNAQTGKLVHALHHNPSLLHLMWCNETRIVTASPEPPGTLTIINFW